MEDRTMKAGRVLLADSHLNMLAGVHSLLETLFETVVMVADERSLIEAAATFPPDRLATHLPEGEKLALLVGPLAGARTSCARGYPPRPQAPTFHPSFFTGERQESHMTREHDIGQIRQLLAIQIGRLTRV